MRARTFWGIGIALALLTLLIFGQAGRFGFICFDDDQYVDHNPALTAGLSPRGLAWAFTTNLTHLSETAEYWEPLTLVSRLADYQAYGFQPGGHHLTSVLLHLLAGLALFGALHRLTGAVWRSAFVAALFLVHPMHVEPVLWLSARKDLVNGLFFILTLWAYGWYAARPSWRRYLLVFAAALAANMGKPMAVSLPFVLLLLDLWPLCRLDLRAAGLWPRRLATLVLEKLPLFILSFGVAVVAYIVQQEIGAMAGADVLPMSWRLGNVALAIGIYVAKVFVPIDLAVFYPHPGRDLNLWLAAGAILGILGFSLLAWRQRHSRPWLLVGWLWFLVVLGPVSGVIQIGEQALADRYSYFAYIGLFIALVWQVAEWTASLPVSPSRNPARIISGGGIVILAIFSALSFLQVQTWRSSETVFRQALRATSGNYVAHFNLGAVLWEQGQRDEAMTHFKEAERIRKPYLQFQLAAAEEALQRDAYGEAIPRLVRILRITPWNAELHFRLGNILALNRERGKALMEFDTALKYQPDWAPPRICIAAILIAEGQAGKAEKVLRDLLAREPGNLEAQTLLARAGQRPGATKPLPKTEAAPAQPLEGGPKQF